MKRRIIILLLALICVAAALCSCGPEIVSSYINNQNQIVAVYDDGTEAVIGTAVTFASNNGQNVTKTTTLMTVTFRYTGDFSAANLNTVIEDIYDQDYAKVPFKVVGGQIKVK